MLTDNRKLIRKKVLVTGAAGFIGSNLISELLRTIPLIQIVGLDNLNSDYDVSLKEYRLYEIDRLVEWNEASRFTFVKGSLSNKELIEYLFNAYDFDIVVHFAARVPDSSVSDKFDSIIDSNVTGYLNILEACRQHNVSHFIFASSAKIYDSSDKTVFSSGDPVSLPDSYEGVTKLTAEQYACLYSKLYNIPSTGLRFFDVYGPAGRPDMDYYRFTEKLISGNEEYSEDIIDVWLDYSYIDDVVNTIISIMEFPSFDLNNENKEPTAPFRIYNIASGQPVLLSDILSTLSDKLKDVGLISQSFDIRSHSISSSDIQTGSSSAPDISPLISDYDYKPAVSLSDGMRKFAEWYKNYRYLT